MLDIDLKKLTEIKTQGRTFLSIYISGPNNISLLERKLDKLGSLIKNCSNKEEQENFDKNKRDVEEYLKKNPLKKGGLCIFTCKEINYFQAISLPSSNKDIIKIDDCPYIRPLAEFYDDYETVAVVVADNQKARIFLVSSSIFGDENIIKGNIKNHVKVGGWSQKRYERRRDKQLLEYSKGIIEDLMIIEKEEKFGHILLVGSKEILHNIYENMPKEFQNKIIEKNLDLSKGEGYVNHEIMRLLEEEEESIEKNYWERIRDEYLRGGLAVIGIDDVLKAAAEGRVDKVIIDQGLYPLVEQCQGDNRSEIDEKETCTVCGLTFQISVINELLRLLIGSGSEYHFADSIPEFIELGGIAALLRY